MVFIKNIDKDITNERVVYEICVVTPYFSFENRVAGGLGVEFEGRFKVK